MVRSRRKLNNRFPSGRGIVPRCGIVMAALIACLACGLIAAAQTPTPSPTPLPFATPLPSPTPDEPMPVQRSYDKPLPPLPDPTRIGVDATNQLSLTLDQAVEMALRNNNDI